MLLDVGENVVVNLTGGVDQRYEKGVSQSKLYYQERLKTSCGEGRHAGLEGL